MSWLMNKMINDKAGRISLCRVVVVRFVGILFVAGALWFVIKTVQRAPFVFVVCGIGTIQDVDGNIYDTVRIGDQCWMKTNLNVTKDPSGAAIKRYCYDDATGCGSNYGGLYTWSTAMNGSTAAGAQGICPAGWHLPTDAEFKTLVEGQATVGCEGSRGGWECSPAGTNLKSSGSLGFEALLAGYRNTSGSFDFRGTFVYFWSSSVSGSDAWFRLLSSGSATVNRNTFNQAHGFSVRCLKD